MKSKLVKGNVTSSGFAALFIAWFFAEGAIGESDTLTPEFFLILPIWAIGALLMWRFVSKNKLENTSYFKIVLSNSLLWLTIPIGLMFAFQYI
ncbi:hypothetical protein AEA09_06340 [Lysinibacillus contaminans]|uniref:Uncharacterized protein n=1 Tax=Lysinibacillus contaminans TaxID=1293441 RepID=A0ABR5JZW8_9BACI|nr:hypothetical protein [Lysinibacillus contaminans]KOS68207.1 hypothetical protein AEA09_06340 [Lysinibacillus contaminans]